jgi:hypothetical protein
MLYPIHEVEELTHRGHQQALIIAERNRELATLVRHRRAVDRLRRALSQGIAAGLDVERVAAELLDFDQLKAN